MIEAEGDSLIREVLEGLVQLLRIGDLTNGQKIKPRRRFEIDRRLRWDWLEAAAPSDAFLAGPSAVLTPYRAGGFAGLDASLSEHVTAVIAACQWDARACGYVFPAALHTHVFGGWRAFADRLERRLRDDGVWDHVSLLSLLLVACSPAPFSLFILAFARTNPSRAPPRAPRYRLDHCYGGVLRASVCAWGGV